MENALPAAIPNDFVVTSILFAAATHHQAVRGGRANMLCGPQVERDALS